MLDKQLPIEFPGGRLRRLTLSDLDAFQAYRALPELGRYQGWSPMSNSEAIRFLNEMSRVSRFSPGNWVQLAIAEMQTDRLIGDLGLYLSTDQTTGEMGYTLQPSYQGRGIATLAVQHAMRLFFQTTKASRILGITDTRNLPSIRLLERLGFECIDIREVRSRDSACSEREYEMQRDNFLKQT